jgi:uncharacterized protein
MRKINMIILGIDLAGKEENPSGICIFDENNMEFSTNYTNAEIYKTVNDSNPSVIVIDAPLSLPKGRCCLEKDCECAAGGHFRLADREIRKYGRVLPLTFTGMKMLTLRGNEIASQLKKKYEVIESHPRTSYIILGYHEPFELLNKLFEVPSNVSEHELDAGILTLTGYMYMKNCHMELGDPDEGTIIIPKNAECLDILKK